MEKRIVDTFIVLSFLIFSGCSLKDDSGSGSFTLKLPDSFSKSAKVGALGVNSCFAVSVSGQELPFVPAGECDPAYGQFTGLVKAGQSVTMEVKKGPARRIDIYYVSSNNGCQPFEPSQGLGKTFGSNRVYLLGSKDVDINQNNMEVTVSIDLPSSGNSLATLHSFPASCQQSVAPLANTIFRATQGSGIFDVPGTGGVKMKLRITDKNLDLSNSAGDRILPIGVEL